MGDCLSQGFFAARIFWVSDSGKAPNVPELHPKKQQLSGCFQAAGHCEG